MRFITLHPKNLLNYLVMHFTGRLSIAQTFLVNGLLVGIILVKVINPYFSDYETNTRDGVFIHESFRHIFFFAVVFWQSIGCIRLAVKQFSRSMWFKVGSVIVIGLFSTYLSAASYLLYLSSPILYSSIEVLVFDHLKEKGEFQWYDSDKVLRYEGEIYDGFYEDFKSKYLKHEDIKKLYIFSGGGYLTEAKATYEFLKGENIITHTNYCASACLIIFLSGKEREADSNSEFYFHMASKAFKDYDNSPEVDYLYKIYKEANVKKDFVDKLILIPYEEFWEPSAHYLLDAGVVTKIVKDE